MNTIITVIAVVSFLGTVFYALRAEKYNYGTRKRRNNSIVSTLCLIIMIICIVVLKII